MSSQPARRPAGFSLLELVVVMSILAILAGAAIPVVTKSLTRSRISDTSGRLARLESAVTAYFEDTGRFPPKLLDLEQNLSGASGWVGPYLRALGAGVTGTATALDQDGWGRPYELRLDGASSLVIASLGPDGVLQSTLGSSPGGGDDGKGKGSDKGKDKGKGKGHDGDGGAGSGPKAAGDDLLQIVDVTPVRRRETLTELATLNAAVASWNATQLPKTPLPTDFDKLLGKLSDGGYLPKDSAPWSTDGWGSAYFSTPKGGSPPMGVASAHVVP